MIVHVDPSSSEALKVENLSYLYFGGEVAIKAGEKHEAMFTLKMEEGPRVNDGDFWELEKKAKKPPSLEASRMSTAFIHVVFNTR